MAHKKKGETLQDRLKRALTVARQLHDKKGKYYLRWLQSMCFFVEREVARNTKMRPESRE